MEVLKIKTKSNSKDTKDKIIELFFTEHLRPVDISKKLRVGMPYITKIIQKDPRYIEEKEIRKLSNKERIKFKNECMHKIKGKKKKQEKQEYQKLLVKINRDNEYLSTKKKENDLQFANWNRSAYEYDKDSSDLVLKDNLNTGFNVAKRVSNVVNPNTIKSNKIYV